MEHTQEPWTTIKTHVKIDGEMVETDTIADSHGAMISGSVKTSSANAMRAIACVNALAGIEDPAAFVEAVKKLGKDDYSDDPETMLLQVGDVVGEIIALMSQMPEVG